METNNETNNEASNETLVYRLRKRAEIRRGIQSRKSVQEGKPDRIAELLEEAAARIDDLEADVGLWKAIVRG